MVISFNSIFLEFILPLQNELPKFVHWQAAYKSIGIFTKSKERLGTCGTYSIGLLLYKT